MKFIQWVLSFFKKGEFTGVLPDHRPQAEKDNDVWHDEFIAKGAIAWGSKPQGEWKKFPKRDQSSSYSCVMQSNAKARGVTQVSRGGNFPVLSAREYNERSNYPSGGTVPFEGLTITTRGLALESLYPSQKMTEDQMDAVIGKNQDVLNSEKQFAGGVPVRLPIDIDTIAGVIDEGYGVVVCLEFPSNEYTFAPFVSSYYANIDHQIAAVDRTIYFGQKALVCEDSAFLGSSQDGQRVLTEQYLTTRSYFIGYVRDIPAPKYAAIPKPVHTFTTDMQFGDRNNEVLLLQQRMIFEGQLSPDCATGYFGNLTKQAVTAYQKANSLPPTGYVGPLTRTKLNQ